MSCSNNLKQLGLAFNSYETTFGYLPIAAEVTEEGHLWRSWRSHLYPIWMAQLPLVYDSSTAWDSEANRRLLDGTPIPFRTKGGTTLIRSMERIPLAFRCPSCSKDVGVNYVVVTGDGTAFPQNAPVRLDDITDGLENTLLVVESITCTPDWTEPRDLEIETMDFIVNSQDKPSISSFHPSGENVCFADGAVFFLTTEVTENELKAMLTIDGAEEVYRKDLIERGVLLKP